MTIGQDGRGEQVTFKGDTVSINPEMLFSLVMGIMTVIEILQEDEMFGNLVFAVAESIYGEITGTGGLESPEGANPSVAE